MGVPRDELGGAARIVWQLEWLAEQAGAEPVDDGALTRAAQVAHVLFLELDPAELLPATRAFLRRRSVDLDAILAWYQPGTRVVPWQRRLGVIDDALIELRPWVEETVSELGATEREALAARRRRFMEAMDVEASRRR